MLTVSAKPAELDETTCSSAAFPLTGRSENVRPAVIVPVDVEPFVPPSSEYAHALPAKKPAPPACPAMPAFSVYSNRSVTSGADHAGPATATIEAQAVPIAVFRFDISHLLHIGGAPRGWRRT